MTHQVRCVRCASGKANRRSPLPGDRSRIASQWLMAGAVLWRSLRRVSTSSETLGARYSVNGVAKEHATSSGSSLNLADAGFGPVSGGNIQGLDLLGSLRGKGRYKSIERSARRPSQLGVLAAADDQVSWRIIRERAGGDIPAAAAARCCGWPAASAVERAS